MIIRAIRVRVETGRGQETGINPNVRDIRVREAVVEDHGSSVRRGSTRKPGTLRLRDGHSTYFAVFIYFRRRGVSQIIFAITVYFVWCGRVSCMRAML